MQKFRIWSDLHLESGSWDPAWFDNSEGQYLILAGDINEIRKHIQIKEFFQLCNDRFIKTFYVPGNHEFWEAYIEKWDFAKKQFAEWGMNNIHVMQRDAITVGDVTVFGCTLWYDASHLNDGRPRAYLKQDVRDYKYIGSMRHGIYTCLRPSDVIFMNATDILWLEDVVPKCTTKKLVVTHHAPTPFSKDPTFNSDHKEYVNDLDLTKIPADLWIHGHVHYSHFYIVDGVTVATNPRGYEIYDALNSNFNHQYTIEL